MSEAALDRPALRLPFRWLVVGALGLAGVAFLGGRHLYKKQGGYRPLALMHVPQTMRYRARVELNDAKRVPQVAPLLAALDASGARRQALTKLLGEPIEGVAREMAFGVGAVPSDFVLVLGLQLQAETGLQAKHGLCRALSEAQLSARPAGDGCRLADGSLVAQTPDGALVLASSPQLVKDLLARPEIGDRLGFSGPSVRGAAPEPLELQREAAALAETLRARYR
jgi:hypothetical protein